MTDPILDEKARNEVSLKEIRVCVETAVVKTIDKTVNGKIDELRFNLNEHNRKHEKDMDRILPVIEAFERGKRDLETATRGGRIVLWLAATVTAIGGSWLVIRAIFYGQ